MIGVPPTHSRGSWMGSGHKGTMDLWLWLLYFLPVSGSLKVLPEAQLDAEWGGSITIKCPLPQTPVRMYLCRQMTDPGTCTTVVSNHFVKKDYKGRVTLKPCLDKKLFLVGMTQLTESDNGVYACGVGINTDRGKTQKITLNVHNEYKPFWEDEPISEPPRWFPKFLQPIPNRHQVVEHASSSEFISKVTTRAPRTEALPAHQPSSMAPVTRRPKLSRTSLVLSTTASKTSAQQALGPPSGQLPPPNQTSWAKNTPPRPTVWERRPGLHIPIPEFHILIPTCLGFLLLVLLGLMVKRAMQRKKAFSRREGRVAMRMRGREASRPVPSQRLGVPQRPRSQSNVYSACPRRAPGPNSMGPAEAPLLSTPASACPALPQVLEAPWPHTPSLKASCEYVTLCHQPAVNVEDADSDDYINIPGLPHLPKVTLDPRPSCQ